MNNIRTIATNDGANVHQWEYVGGANQQWQLAEVGDGYYKIINRHSNKALDVSGGVNSTSDGGNVHQWSYIGASNQQWQLVKVASTSSVARKGNAANQVAHNTEISQHISAFPNPFLNSITFSIHLQARSNTEVKFHNAIGGSVKSVYKGYLDAGTHYFEVDTKSFADGIYFCTVTQNGWKTTKKLIKISY